MTREAFEEVYYMRSCLPQMCWKICIVFSILFCHATLQFSVLEGISMGSSVKARLGTLATQVLFSAGARAEVWELYQLPRDRHNAWRIDQTKAFDDLKGLLWSTVCSTWEALPWAQKLLIIAPVVTVFVHFYLMPWMMPRLRYFWIWLRMEYELYQRRQAVYRSLHSNLG
ncbi:hypothetical protein FB45DRAFT_871868 [Roridomyces roridus]|uniref:Uncharacterized protein n=1 Tax=Roridomyces roridus TaxID=1738132 RepID=A0AAD7BDS7_9AGAR|nr:hypothetical protein FB45DRAFT_871868 [Roridomyces roridus]